MTYANLTEGEIRMLKLVAESQFRDDGDLTAVVWQPTENKSDRGYLGSLVKKGLCGVDNITKGEETAWLTTEGISIYKSLKK